MPSDRSEAVNVARPGSVAQAIVLPRSRLAPLLQSLRRGFDCPL